MLVLDSNVLIELRHFRKAKKAPSPSFGHLIEYCQARPLPSDASPIGEHVRVWWATAAAESSKQDFAEDPAKYAQHYHDYVRDLHGISNVTLPVVEQTRIHERGLVDHFLPFCRAFADDVLSVLAPLPDAPAPAEVERAWGDLVAKGLLAVSNAPAYSSSLWLIALFAIGGSSTARGLLKLREYRTASDQSAVVRNVAWDLYLYFHRHNGISADRNHELVYCTGDRALAHLMAAHKYWLTPRSDRVCARADSLVLQRLYVSFGHSSVNPWSLSTRKLLNGQFQTLRDAYKARASVHPRSVYIGW